MHKKHVAVGAFLALVSMIGFGFASDTHSNLPTLQPRIGDTFKGTSSIDIHPLPPIRRDGVKGTGDSTDNNINPKPRDLPRPLLTGSVGTGRVGGDDHMPKGTGQCDNTGKTANLATEYAKRQAQIAQWNTMMTAQVQQLLTDGKITAERAATYTAHIQDLLQKKNAELTKRYNEQSTRLSTNTCKGGDRGGDKPKPESHNTNGHEGGSSNGAGSSTDQNKLNEITMRANKIQNALNKATQDGSLSPEKIAEYQNYLINELQKRKDAITK